MAKKNKFYVVWEGQKTGIFTTWKDCQSVTKGYPQAKFKSFDDLQSAKEAFSKSYFDFAGKKNVFKSTLSESEALVIGDYVQDSLSVDAACSGNPGKMEYRGVYVKTKQEVFIKGPFEQATNNIGEFLALVHGLALLKEKGLDIPIYSDSKIAISWIKSKKCRTNLEQTSRNTKVFELIHRAENWLNSNTFQNKILKWETKAWGEIPADFGRKQ